MHNHDRQRLLMFAEGRQRPSGHGCQSREFGPRQGGHREFGHRPGGPRFGEDGPQGFRGGPRGPRAKTGNLRLAVLALLQGSPRNGYSLMGEIAQRSGGLWQPSPGSMYPVLSQLEDEGLIMATEQDGKKAYALTEAGQQFVKENQEALNAVWDMQKGADEQVELRGALRALMGAASQVAQAGSAAQAQEAVNILKAARKSLYRLLAEDDAE